MLGVVSGPHSSLLLLFADSGSLLIGAVSWQLFIYLCTWDPRTMDTGVCESNVDALHLVRQLGRPHWESTCGRAEGMTLS